jgi:hypothetical protein
MFRCAVSFKSKKKKIPDLSLPPCIIKNKQKNDNSIIQDFTNDNILLHFNNDSQKGNKKKLSYNTCRVKFIDPPAPG